MNKLASIQLQDISGRWFTISTVTDNDSAIKLALDNAKKLYSTKKIRAVNSNGEFIDIRI